MIEFDDNTKLIVQEYGSWILNRVRQTRFRHMLSNEDVYQAFIKEKNEKERREREAREKIQGLDGK